MLSKRMLALFALAYLLALLATAPASLLDAALQRASQNHLALANAAGTIWNGSATLSLRQQNERLVALQALRWEISAASLLNGKMLVRLQVEGQSAVTEATLTPGQIELQHVQLQLPAHVLDEASPLLKPAQFRGQLHIQSEHLAFSPNGVEGNAVVDWQQASSALSSIAPLGNYHLALNGTGKRIAIALATTSGILMLDGQGEWKAGRGLEFHGKARAAGGDQDSLSELLHHLGPEIAPGVRGINLFPQ
ncbi:MAG: type II secretion system protein N [Nitrosomonadales bacterium]|nr:type II secretion system protein N [Nitrosomonadales bacterium]